ncbi:uncharacterized protein LOC127858503 [Dreissena polymorpha]|uniref:Uncharacterized protein n=1 Tax=Dreissena polymorpha TaxID=45954 RepID=A0A9D3Z265_DREPO|nr:uncharacterized protein LOC127858503 [Dreissena polymorpha]KAH3710334.1 hypothetical protein DPMN_069811 [Dreissena polymorpha]
MKLLLLGSLTVLLVWSSLALPTDDEIDQEIDQEILDAAARATNEDDGKSDDEKDVIECLKACAEEGESQEYCMAACLDDEDDGLGQRTIEKQRKRGWLFRRWPRIPLPRIPLPRIPVPWPRIPVP